MKMLDGEWYLDYGAFVWGLFSLVLLVFPVAVYLDFRL